MISLFFRLLIFLSLFGASSAYAGYLDNFSDWKKQERYSQYMYVQGLFDAWMNDGAFGEPSWVSARRNGLSNCFVSQRITPAMLSDAVSAHYQANVEDWSFPPATIMAEVTQRICLSHINEERAKVGLSAWQRKAGSITSGMRN